ncbi:helix-turn-helix domain-containing protein [Streptomyces sp. NPDC091272]|uniref:helix-turn-helix domain-containing protein n=1 Tax=Streptomyces sp. NPDC091272 TaxID=3365981 RepID=UPI003822757D
MAGIGGGDEARSGAVTTRFNDRVRVTRPWRQELRPYVHCYDGYRVAAATSYRVRLVPRGRAVVVINLGEPFAQVFRLSEADPGVRVVGSLVAGLEDGPRVCDHPGGQEAIRLELTPLGAYRLFGVPMRELTNTVTELRDVLGPEADELVERMSATPDWARRFDLLDAALLTRLDGGPDPSPEVAHAWRLLTRSAGTIPVARIATEVGWSHGHLVRRFTQQVGLTPKMSARVLRFHRSVELLSREGTDLGDLAATCGFYDQAHLNREFRALAGVTPLGMAAARRVEGAHEL